MTLEQQAYWFNVGWDAAQRGDSVDSDYGRCSCDERQIWCLGWQAFHDGEPRATERTGEGT